MLASRVTRLYHLSREIIFFVDTAFLLFLFVVHHWMNWSLWRCYSFLHWGGMGRRYSLIKAQVLLDKSFVTLAESIDVLSRWYSRAEIKIQLLSLLFANACSVSEFGRIRIPPGQHHLLRQLGMVRLELGWSFCETNNDCVHRRGDETKQGGAQDKADSCSDEKGTGNDRSILLH